MRPLARFLGVLAFLIAACGPAPQSAPPTGSGPSGAPTPASASTVRVYLYLAGPQGATGLVAVSRPLAAGVAAGPQAAIDALLGGPTDAELAATPPLSTSLPAGLRLLGLAVTGGIVTVDLSGEVQGTSGSDVQRLRAGLAQIVFTATQFPDISGVLFTTEGTSLDVVDRDGNPLSGPVARAAAADLLAPIFVDTPAWGETVTSPIALSGLADVFEAQFKFRLLVADGRSLADGQLSASCGTGCRGTFGVSVPFFVPGATPAHLQVFDVSAADGSMVDLVDYPLQLVP